MALSFSARDPQPDLLQFLKTLVQANLDSSDGWAHAGEQLEDPQLAALCDHIAKERRAQSEEIARCLPRSETIPEQGSLTAAFARAWLQVRELLSHDNTETLLTELERCEESLKQIYEETLDHVAGAVVTDTVVRHYSQVALAYHRVRDLRDLYRVRNFSPDSVAKR